MRKNLLVPPIRFILLCTILLSAFSTKLQAQCSATISAGNQTVCAGASATISITFTGTAPFTFAYQINGAPQLPVQAPTINYDLVINGVSQTSVIVLSNMQDGTGCQGTVSGVTTVQVSPPITLNAVVLPVTCTQGNDGSIQVTPSGGVAPYTYVWSTGASTEPVLEGLDEGNYSVTVTDANGCEAYYSTTLELQFPVYGFQATPAYCDAPNGTINITLNSPSAYVIWSNGANTEDLTNIPAGTYTVTVTEALNGCTNSSSITVPALGSPMVITPVITPISCNGGTDGSVILSVTGGTPPYTYIWSNGSTANLSSLSAGTYTVTVTDAYGCTKTASATVQQPTAINIAPTIQSPTCGNDDGAIDLALTGGVPTYTVAWSTGSQAEDISNLGAGTYTATVTDASGCTKNFSTTIGPFDLSAQVGYSGCTGNIDLSVAGGTGPYSYFWSNNANTEDLAEVPGGTYTVTVTDALGCTGVKSVLVTSLSLITASISLNSNLCSGNLTALITGWPATSTSFSWSTGSTSQILTNVPAGVYTVTATASNSCTATASITTIAPVTNSLLTVSGTTTPVACSGNATGAINLTVSGYAPPFSYLWSNAAVTEDLTGLVAGAYFVTVTDANGCTKSGAHNITQPFPITASWQVTNGNCTGSLGSVTLAVSGGNPPYIFTWRNAVNNIISTSSNLNGVPPGTYTLTVTDSGGCTYTSPGIVVQSTFFSITVEPLSSQCNSAALTLNIVGGAAPFEYEWTGPNGFVAHTVGPNIEVPSSGIYTAIVTDANGCSAQSSFQVSLSGGICGYLKGRVVIDAVEDCVADINEAGLAGWLVRAESPLDTFYGVTDLQGKYVVGVPTGTYTMAVVPPNALWEPCPAGPLVTVDAVGDTIPGGDLPVKILYQCPSLSVLIGTNQLRRCFDNNYYYIEYCNEGTIPATDAYILVTLDPFLIPMNATFPYTNLGGGVLRFDVGQLEVGECGTIQLRVQVNCNALIGQTHCTEAHIFPDGNCLPNDPNWSGASLRVSSLCNQDSVRFTIQNFGVGDMQESSNYIVIEDAVMRMQASFQLTSGGYSIVSVPSNGSTWRIEVDQEVFHPGISSPALSVEGCTTAPSFSTGYVNQFPNDDADPWLDIDCTQNIGSYDPNDKQGFPLGYSDEHYIRPGTELEYMIRFQNTGTDTAFTVRVVDTLSSWLDPATIRPGVSSHPYQFNFTEQGIASFLFENILLPDSNINQIGSNGFVKFSIYPRADAPLETLIENTAAIYFDFNDPVITNTTRHRLGENFLTVGAWQPQRPEYQVLVSPNPFSETARLEVKGLESSAPIHLQIMDLRGRVVQDETVAGPVINLKKSALPTGMYLFRLEQKGVLIGSGKLVVKE